MDGFLWIVYTYTSYIPLQHMCVSMLTWFLKCKISIYYSLLTCNISKKGIFLYKSQKNFFLFFMGDESPNAHESKSMIRLVPSAQQLTLQSSKVQNCQHWGQLLGGSPSTFLIALGEIISIFIYIFGFHWKILLIMMFGN